MGGYMIGAKVFHFVFKKYRFLDFQSEIWKWPGVMGVHEKSKSIPFSNENVLFSGFPIFKLLEHSPEMKILKTVRFHYKIEYFCFYHVRPMKSVEKSSCPQKHRFDFFPKAH